MSFSVSCGGCGLEYSGRRPFAQPRNAASPRFLALALGDRPLAAHGAALARRGRLRAALARARTSTSSGYSQRFRRHFLVPLTSALWSTAPGRALEFPAAYAIRFFDNHGMLGFGRFRWRTVERRQPHATSTRSRDRLGGRVCGSASASARSGATPDGVELRTDDGAAASLRRRRGRDARRPGARAARGPERRGAARARRVRVHDERGRPPHRLVVPAATRRAARASWNYRLGDDGRPTITYYLNRLQALDGETGLLRDAERGGSPTSTCSRGSSYDHPLYTVDTLAAQRELPALSGRRRTVLRGRVPRQRLPRGRPRVRRRAPRPRSGWTGEVGALRRDADARAAHAGAQRLPLPGLVLARSTSTSCPSSSGGCALVSVNRPNVVSLRDADHFDGDRPLKQAVLDLAGDPAIERVLDAHPAARARLRLQPGQLLLVLPRRRRRSPAWSPS